MRFLEEVILTETGDSSVEVFFSEIDSVLPLPFADDFFTSLRALYNARAVKPTLRRLSFVLLEVADAADFVRDSRQTPFNIGTTIPLQNFDPQDTEPFREVLGDKRADLIKRIFYWSGGQPFMVQSLAAAVNDQTLKSFDVATSQRLRTFRGHEGRFEPGSIAFSPDSDTLVSVSNDGTLRIWWAAVE